MSMFDPEKDFWEPPPPQPFFSDKQLRKLLKFGYFVAFLTFMGWICWIEPDVIQWIGTACVVLFFLFIFS